MHPKTTPFGAMVMTSLGLLAVVVVALPMLIGLVVVRLLPGIGEPRAGVGAAALLHLLWIIPVLWLAAVMVGAVAKGAMLRWRIPRVTARVAESVVMWLVLALPLTIYFARFEAALLAAAIGLVLLFPVTRWLERRNAETDAEGQIAAGG